ncbi:CCA tRNA nucleotidyltransferase [Chloracidobacterium sp. D]|uniref:CCA tRNA nucleotidyltransferase n=1 Tax=Chloracidobacterium sp. D TaxID=2821536 RepID=UPI001B8D89E7|nr:CCA tRNA nucleotidyltransferase [Chloracidobacterium sp. D]QUV81026.1 CCA tRNA nucleotidyltransferase [Chloracidobacterium sp. D]
MADSLPAWLIELCKDIRSVGGKAFLVGGCVRDKLLGYPIKDYDIEVYGLPSEQLRELLEKHGKVSTVGEHFAVYKLKPNVESAFEIDVSLPRRESKQGYGHRGFFIQGDPWMSIQEAASRRDFTINAILQDPLDGNIIDPCQGLHHLNSRELQVVNTNTFKDDSLRVLRAAQLSSRYQLKITSDTKILCQEIDLTDIPKERIWNEVKKLLLLSPRPSLGFEYLLELRVVEQLFPMLYELQSSLIGENPYPMKSGWDYVLTSLDRGKMFTEELSEPEKISVLLSIVGTRLSNDSLTRFLDALGFYAYQGYQLRTQIILLSKIHLLPYKIFHQLQKQEVSTFALRRIARITDLKLVICLSKALYLGDSEEMLTWLEEKSDSAKKLLSPILRGHHILKMGMTPGPKVGKLLRQIHEHQIDEKVKNFVEAQQLAKSLLCKRVSSDS